MGQRFMCEQMLNGEKILTKGRGSMGIIIRKKITLTKECGRLVEADIPNFLIELNHGNTIVACGHVSAMYAMDGRFSENDRLKYSTVQVVRATKVKKR